MASSLLRSDPALRNHSFSSQKPMPCCWLLCESGSKPCYVTTALRHRVALPGSHQEGGPAGWEGWPGSGASDHRLRAGESGPPLRATGQDDRPLSWARGSAKISERKFSTSESPSREGRSRFQPRTDSLLQVCKPPR